jgi:hypothetical protein
VIPVGQRTITMLAGLLATLLLPGGCMTERLPLPTEHAGIPRQSSFLVKRIAHDEHGRPMFSERLTLRPGTSGDTFTLVEEIDDLPSRSYDIAVVDRARTEGGPLAVIYEWTGRGYEGGLDITSGISVNGTISSGAEAVAFLAIKAAPIVIATATGFVVGVLTSIPEAAKELQHVIVNTRETVIAYRTYSHDDQGRIRFMKLYAPDERAEPLVTTSYLYAGKDTTPVRTEVVSAAEQKVRQVP